MISGVHAAELDEKHQEIIKDIGEKWEEYVAANDKLEAFISEVAEMVGATPK